MPLVRLLGPVLLALAPFCTTRAVPLVGQEPGRVLGTVVDAASGQGVPDVQVRLLEPVNATVITNGEGRFLFTRVPAGIHELEVTHIAYGSRTELVNIPANRTVEVRVEMVQEAIDVGAVRVQVSIREPGLERRGYYERIDFGFGRFFDEKDLSRRSLQSALREVPRLRLAGSGFTYTPVFMRGSRWCRPVIWVDHRMIRLQGAGFEEMVDPYNIAAMEVYRPGETPGEFMELTQDCGAIVIWTYTNTR